MLSVACRGANLLSHTAADLKFLLKSCSQIVEHQLLHAASTLRVGSAALQQTASLKLGTEIGNPSSQLLPTEMLLF